MTHSGNRQGLAEVLLCPEEAVEGVCLSLPELMAAASGEQKHQRFDFKRTNTNKISLTCLRSGTDAHETQV